MKKKEYDIVYIISLVEKSVAFECIAAALQKRYKLAFLLLNPGISPLEKFLMEKGIEVIRFKFAGKSDYPRVFLSVLFYLLRRRPKAVHAHLLDAQLLGLMGGWLTRIPKRIYTRHTSTYHHVYFRSGIKYDKWSNWLATHVVSVSQATDYTLSILENVKKEKIRKIYHGFHLADYTNVHSERMNALKVRWSIAERRPVIGVIARHIEWKGIQYIIPAFARLLDDYPSAMLILANARGPFQPHLMKQLATLPVSSFVMVPFEEDIVSLYAMFDVYVHVPVDAHCEAFGQTYVEALAAQIPSVFTKSGVGAEFLEHAKNAWVVNFRDSEGIYHGMLNLLKNRKLQEELKKEGYDSVKGLFDLGTMTRKLETLYDE